MSLRFKREHARRIVVSKKSKLTSFQLDLLAHLYEQQRRYDSGHWNFDGSIQSRTSYGLASARGQLLRSPARGRWNMTRQFEQRFTKALTRLVKLELCEWRVTKPPEGPAAFSAGYKRHKVRERDVFLTARGLGRAEAELRRSGMMASGVSGCDGLADPTGPSSVDLSGCDD